MNEEIRRRTDPIRIFPNRQSALRLLTAMWQDIHEGWLTGRRYLNMELLAEWKEEQARKDKADPAEGSEGSHRKIRT